MFSVESALFVLAVACVALPRLWAKYRLSLVYRAKYTGLYVLMHFGALVMIPSFAFGLTKRKITAYTCALYRFLARPMGLVWEVRGGQHLACGEAFIVANHQSALDLLGLAYVKQFDGRVLLCPKKEVLYYWPLGLWAYLIGDIFLDKSNPKAAYRKLEMAMRSIMNQKMTPRDDGRDDIRNQILLFPEGIRNRKPDFLPFKKGAFVTAIGAGVPIVPMVYSPYYFLNRENMIFNDGRVILKFLEPISTSGLKPGDAERLAEEVRQKMFDVYNELGEEIMLTLPKNYPMEDKWKSIMLPKTKTASRTV